MLEERDDGDMPALIGAYRQSAQALGRADSRLTENIEQTSEMLRLVEKTQELLQDTGRADPKFMASLKQFGSAVDDLLNQEQAAQEQVREAGSLAGEVVQAAPRKRRPTASEGRKAAPTEAAKEGSSPAAGRPPSGEEASTPGVTPEGTSPAGEPAASAPSPAGSAADREPQAAPPAGRTRNPWVFLGGVAVLAAGAGLLAWVIARLIATRDGSSRGGPRRSV